jgi:cytochrome c553
MIHTRIPTILGAAVIAAALAGTAQTAEIAADPSTTREFNAKMLMCGQCHGLNGVPVRPAIPIIWGQQQNYLLKQLQDFRNKSRDAEIMTWAALTLHPEEEMAYAAAYFAKKSWPTRPTLVASPAAPRGMAVCQACHQADYRGAPQAEGLPAPRLAGQTYEYLVQTMNAYADGTRKNNDTMAQIMAGIPAAEREAMARYLSGL